MYVCSYLSTCLNTYVFTFTSIKHVRIHTYYIHAYKVITLHIYKPTYIPTNRSKYICTWHTRIQHLRLFTIYSTCSTFSAEVNARQLSYTYTYICTYRHPLKIIEYLDIQQFEFLFVLFSNLFHSLTRTPTFAHNLVKYHNNNNVQVHTLFNAPFIVYCNSYLQVFLPQWAVLAFERTKPT